MGKVEKIEQQIKALSDAFDAKAWDRQLDADVQSGKLDALGEQALKAHAAGKTTKL